MKTIELTRGMLDEIILHAQREVPRECCGILAGTTVDSRNVVRNRHPLTNEAANPERGYFASPGELFKTMQSMRIERQEMVGIYHSHPNGEARPSPTDLELAFYKTIYVIVGLGGEPEVRAFDLDEGIPSEVAIVVA